MILTGKAKEDFLYWNHHIKNNDHVYIDIEPRSIIIGFSDIDDILQHTLIIDWLDSVGIYIELGRFTSGLKFEFWHYTISDTRGIHLNNHMGNTVKEDSRHEATKQAILKANQIYNKRGLIAPLLLPPFLSPKTPLAAILYDNIYFDYVSVFINIS